MTKNEETYAAWLNVLGSDHPAADPVEQDMTVLRIVAMCSGDSDRFGAAYVDVLMALAPEVGAARAKELTEALVSASRAHRVWYIPGIPLMIDGVDCCPDHIRSLEKKAGRK